MRIFFLQLFLSFWLATIVIFVAATVFSPDTLLSPDELEAIVQSSRQHSAEVAVADLRSRGCSAASLNDPRWLLADAQGRPICNRQIEDNAHDVLRQAVNRGSEVGQHSGKTWIQAAPIVLGSGETWYVVQWSTFGSPPWFPHFPPTALPVSIVVTFVFAYSLTRPLKSLSTAFRSFTAGELDVRLPIKPQSRFGRFDSADVRTLMADFNSMADRVTELIDAHKMLVRDISHELRSPLTRLGLALELAREKNSLDQSDFDQMEQEAYKVNELIGEMLTLSLLESTTALPRAELVDMRVLIENLLVGANFEANAHGCSIQFEAHGTAEVSGQPEMLSRAIENIVRNAIRYTPVGGLVDIELNALDERQAAEARITRRAIRVSIRDTGPGIPLDHLSHIFRPFYRVDLGRSESSGGFGVGLAIAERAIHLHGGKIMAINREVGGLDVQILLPSALHSS